MKKENTKLYLQVLPGKLLSEKYLGHLNVGMPYSVVAYTADCTQGVPFDMFDKVIVGLLQIEEGLSLEDIGEILGMNVRDAPEEFRMKDPAEYDILKDALVSLHQFEMIELGDVDCSSCALTPIGRKYAELGMKFKRQKAKPFDLHFDHLSGKYFDASDHFKNKGGQQEDFEMVEAFEDRGLLREIIARQRPDIYNPSEGNLYENLQLNILGSKRRRLEVKAALLYNLDQETFRVLAYDKDCQEEIPFATKWLNENRLEELVQEWTSCDKGALSPEVQDPFMSYVLDLLLESEESQKINDPKALAALFQKVHSQMTFVDPEYFWNKLGDFVGQEVQQVFCFLPEPAEMDLLPLSSLLGTKSAPDLFCIHPPLHLEDTEDPPASFELLNGEREAFLLEQKTVSRFETWLLGEEEVEVFALSRVDLPPEGKGIGYRTLHRRRVPRKEMAASVAKIKRLLAEKWLPLTLQKVEGHCISELAKEAADKQTIAAYSDLGKEIWPLRDAFGKEEMESFQAIEDLKAQLVAEKKAQLGDQLMQQLQDIQGRYSKLEEPVLKDFVESKRQVAALKEKSMEDLAELLSAIGTFLDTLEEDEKKWIAEKAAKVYVIDTNVFIEDPQVLDKVPKKDRIALNLTVLDELDRLKTRPETKSNAQRAIRNINKLLKQTKGKDPRIRKVKADLSRLPEELRKKSGDNYLLSIALAIKDGKAILLTFDKNLQNKARFLDIDFQTPRNLEIDGQINFAQIFHQMEEGKEGRKRVEAFIQAIRKAHPDFSYKVLGHKRAWEFVASLPGFEVVEKHFITFNP